MIRLKNKNQIELIRKSGHLLFRTFEHLKDHISPGISTFDIDRIAEEFILRNGGRPAFKGYAGFPNSVCTSKNSHVIHGIPGKKDFLKNGDIIGLDIGIDLDGYISDSAYTYPVGKVSNSNLKLLEITENSLYKGIEACIVGNRIKDIGKAITDYVSRFNYGIVHQYCGHGVGLEVHEEPQIFNNYPTEGKNPRIKSGMVLAIEPMINLGLADVKVLSDDWTVATTDGLNSAHFEHTVAVYKDRTEVLTKI
ncbi:MAG: type I methionyl aminopeptidase [Spirochaetaceae bacterium]